MTKSFDNTADRPVEGFFRTLSLLRRCRDFCGFFFFKLTSTGFPWRWTVCSSCSVMSAPCHLQGERLPVSLAFLRLQLAFSLQLFLQTGLNKFLPCFSYCSKRCKVSQNVLIFMSLKKLLAVFLKTTNQKLEKFVFKTNNFLKKLFKVWAQRCKPILSAETCHKNAYHNTILAKNILK